jgi:hypothetical protein
MPDTWSAAAELTLPNDTPRMEISEPNYAHALALGLSRGAGYLIPRLRCMIGDGTGCAQVSRN